jgi:hypothetical protein
MVKSMPSWDVHNKWASKLGVGKDIADPVNRIIDSIGDPEYHDYGRVIVGDHGSLASSIEGFDATIGCSEVTALRPSYYTTY